MSLKINKGFVKIKLSEKDLSLRDLANSSEMGEATLYRIMNGAKFNITTLEKLADVLECSPIDLLDVSEYPAPHMVASPA
jgi:DNA-binding Xre family transcriptional regulator